MKKILILASIAVLFSACDKDCKEPITDNDQISISALMAEVTPETRTTDDGTNAAWVTNDVVGVFCAQSNPAAVNTQFTYSGSTWSTASPIYWADNTTAHKFYAYAPQASGNTAAAVAIPILNSQTGTINSAQNILFSNNLDAGITKTTNNGNAALIFKHALALIQLNITIDASVTAGTKLSSASILGQAAETITTSATGATLNIVTGAITGSSALSNSITVQPTSAVTLSTTAVTLNVLLLPSTSSPNLTIQSTFPDNSTGSATILMGSNLTFAQSTKYTYNVTVSRNAINITGFTITPWTSSGPPTSLNPIL